MTTQHLTVVDLDDEVARDPERVGHKAAILATLRADGAPVPPGLVLLPEADVGQAAAQVHAQFGERPVAVRSSSRAEDLADASFAGQYATLLDVRGRAALADAITTVRASALDPVARGYATDAMPMPVLVMPMVPADAAGVAFSVDPVTGDDRIVVEAVAGLGEALAAGTATPQRWLVEDGRDPAPQPGGPQVLDPERVAAVAELVREVAATQGVPQDVEWAVVGTDVHLLQARPATALPLAPTDEPPPPRETWARADENYAHPVRELEFSVWAPRLEQTATDVFAEVGAPIETMAHRRIGGWMYGRVVPPMDQGRDDQAAPPAWLFGLMLRVVPPIRRRLARAAEVWASDLGDRAAADWEEGGRDRMRARTRALRLVDRPALDDEGLAAHVEEVLDHLQAAADVHFRLPVLATFLPTGHLGVLVERLLGWGPDRALRLLQGWSTVTDVADEIGVLAAAIVADPVAVELLHRDPTALLDHDGAAGAAVRAHLDQHGHRATGTDLARPTLAEDPTPLLALVRARVDAPVDDGDRRATSAAVEAEALSALADRPDDLAEFTATLARARAGFSLGDDTEIDVLECFAVVRYCALEAGRRLVARGDLHSATDTLHLTEQELLAALRGAPITADVPRRIAEHRWAAAHPGPARYGPPPASFPSLRWAPSHVRPFLEAMVWAMDRLAAPQDTGEDTGADDGLRGVGASPGRATGPVRVITDPVEFDRIRPGDVLVCRCTIAAWSVVFPVVGAVVTEVGGPLSHPGILAREFGIPAVLAVRDATTVLTDGQQVTVDGSTGLVEVLA